MALLKDDGCFVCGQGNDRGFKVSVVVDKEKGEATFTTIIPSHLQGWQGVAHGGILATLLDEVCVYAARTLGDQLVTAELTVKYHKPVQTETPLVLRGRVIGRRRRLVEAEGFLEIDGEVYAEATSKVVLLKKENP